MNDTTPQTASGKVLWHFSMSLDGFVAGPNHEMDWMTGASFRPGLVEPAEAVRIGLAAAGGKNLEVFSPTIGRQLLELGLIDEIDLHIAPVLLGEGIRLYDNPGSEPIFRERASDGTKAEVNVRYRPTRR